MQQAKLTIRNLLETDWPQVQAIYNAGIETGNATFEAQAPTWCEWNESHLNAPRLVAEEEGLLMGWAALSPVSRRAVYKGVAEVSVYVGPRGRGRGIGSQLLGSLIELSEAEGIWTLQAGIFPENRASISIHLGNGFREVGRRERIG